MCESIPDTLHYRVALIGHSGRLGNTLIVSHTSPIYATLPAVSAFITSFALRPSTRKKKEETVCCLEMHYYSVALLCVWATIKNNHILVKHFIHLKLTSHFPVLSRTYVVYLLPDPPMLTPVDLFREKKSIAPLEFTTPLITFHLCNDLRPNKYCCRHEVNWEAV